MDQSTIEGLVEAGRVELERQERARQAETERREREQEERAHWERTRFEEAARAALPEVLHPFLHVPEDTLSAISSSYWIRIAVPGCSVMWANFERKRWDPHYDAFPKERGSWAWDGSFNTKGEPYVRRPGYPDEESGVDYYSSKSFDARDLHLALGWSAQVCEKAKRLQARLDEEQAEQMEAAAIWARERAAREAAAADRKQERFEEQEFLMREIENDPVALGLLRVFLVVQEGRWREAEALLEV